MFDPRARLIAAVVAGLLVAAGWGLRFLGAGDGGWPGWSWPSWVSLAIGLVYGGRPALEAARTGRFTVDVLMVVAAAFAAGSGHPEDGALLLVLFVLSGALEALAMRRTTREVEALHRMMPKEAERWAEGAWTACEPGVLAPGDRIRVRPGELVPADSVVATGRTSIDQAAMTGESLPRPVGPGDEVFAGTINTGDVIEARVIRPAAESGLQRILNLVTTAQAQREPVQRAIDRLSQPYSIGVMVASTLVFALWWAGLGRGAGESLATAITLLIVASPCALVISTPTATLAAIGRGARAGVLFKGGTAIDRLARLGAVCLDKTGTLTVGRPGLDRIDVIRGDERSLLAAAARLEAGSTHPLARAVVDAARARGPDPASADGVRHAAGRGLSVVEDGREVRVGSPSFVADLVPAPDRARMDESVAALRREGKLGAVVAAAGPGGVESAVLWFADEPRRGAAGLGDALRELGVDPVRLLTGDHARAAAPIAALAGIADVSAGLLPEDKLRIVAELKAAKRGGRRGAVGVIGDGVNDAPALAAADVAIAIGSIGSDAALESADIVLVGDDLAAVPWAVRLARRARATVTANLVVSLGVIAVMAVFSLVSAFRGTPVSLPVAVLAHEGSTVVVVVNSLTILLMPGVRAGRARSDTSAGPVLATSRA